MTNIINRSSSFLLLGKQAIHQIRQSYFKSMVLIVGHLVHQVSEFFIIFEISDFKSAHIFFLFSLFYAHKADILLQTHQFSFDTLENFVQEHWGGVALAIYHLIVWFLHL